MRNKIKNNLIFIILAILTILTMIGVILYFGNLKQGFHMDELLTYGLSNSYFEPFPFQYEEWFSSTYYHDYLVVNESDAFAYDSVYYNQEADVHPPFYYIVIHTVSSIFQDNFTKWIGIGVNILFFILIIGVLFSFIKYLLKDKWIALFVTSFWGFSIGAVSSVMYIRMYVFLTFWFVLFIFVSTKLLNEENHSWQMCLTLFLVTIGGTLTQYYFLIGAFFISLVLCLIFFLQKRWEVFYQFAFTMFSALLTSYLIFPPIIKHLFETARGKEAVNNMVEGTNYFWEYLAIVDRSLFARNGIIIMIVLLGAIIFSISKINIERLNIRFLISNAALILVPAFLYIIVIQKIAPYRTSRYIFSVFPMFVVGTFFILIFAFNLLIKNKHLLRSIIFLLVFSSIIYGYRHEQVEYLYSDYTKKLNVAKDYQDNNALVIHDAKWKITGNILELKEFDEILPLEINPNEIILPEDDKLLNENDLVVFINKAFNQQTLINLISEKYGFHSVKQIYDSNATLVYFFE